MKVENALGKPDDITTVKEALIYTYPTVKVECTLGLRHGVNGVVPVR